LSPSSRPHRPRRSSPSFVHRSPRGVALFANVLNCLDMLPVFSSIVEHSHKICKLFRSLRESCRPLGPELRISRMLRVMDICREKLLIFLPERRGMDISWKKRLIFLLERRVMDICWHNERRVMQWTFAGRND
jgi:hypothetical protein